MDLVAELLRRGADRSARNDAGRDALQEIEHRLARSRAEVEHRSRTRAVTQAERDARKHLERYQAAAEERRRLLRS